MVVKVAESNLPELLSWLQQYLPETFQPYQELKNHLRGKFPNFTYYVDTWPDPQAVAVIVDPMGKEFECKGYLLNFVHGVFGVTDAAVAKVLKDSRVVDWSKDLWLCAVPNRLWPGIQKVAEEMQASGSVLRGYLLKATSQDIKTIPVPEGMKIVPVSMDHIKAIASTWKYSTEGVDAFIKEQIYQFPSVLLTTDGGQHVGHMIGQVYGALGKLYVYPQFRGHGFAKVIISQLSQKYFDNGEDAYVFIVDENQPSKKLHESMGFKTLQNFQVGWLHYTPRAFETKV